MSDTTIQKMLTVSASPHKRTADTTRGIMLDVIIAMVPALIVSVILFGPRTLLVTFISVIFCVLFEYLSGKAMKRNNTIGDLSAVVTGMLLAFNLPSTMPLWMVIIGDAVAIIVVKQFFGGIGQNFVNPALVGRIVLMASFPVAISDFPSAFRVETRHGRRGNFRYTFGTVYKHLRGGKHQNRHKRKRFADALQYVPRRARRVFGRNLCGGAVTGIFVFARAPRDFPRNSADLHRHGCGDYAYSRERQSPVCRLSTACGRAFARGGLYGDRLHHLPRQF